MRNRIISFVLFIAVISLTACQPVPGGALSPTTAAPAGAQVSTPASVPRPLARYGLACPDSWAGLDVRLCLHVSHPSLGLLFIVP